MELDALIEATSRLDLTQLKRLIEHAESVRRTRRDEMRAELEKQADAIGLIVSEPSKPPRNRRRSSELTE